MPFTILHPIKSRIYNQSGLLEFLISDFSDMQYLWEKKVHMDLRQEAKAIATGDEEIEMSVTSQMLNSFGNNREYEGCFYNAMLVLVFSYYEDLICTIYDEVFPGSPIRNIPRLSDICQQKSISLSDKAKEDAEFVCTKVRLLRNYITHNKWGKPNNSADDIKSIKDLSQQYQDIACDDSTLCLRGCNFLLDALGKERSILLELSEKLGFTSHMV